jgi:hypothetical protein
VLLYGVVLVGAAAFFALFQFQTENLLDFDGYFHIKYATILRTDGPRYRLPWLQCTIYSRSYRDHHFLFHVLLIPFTWLGDLRLGAKIAATAFPAVMGLSFFHLLRVGRVPWSGVWMVALAGAGTHFMLRMLAPRPMAGSLALLLLAAAFLIGKRRRALAALAAGAVWFYDGFGMIVVLALLFFAAEWLVEGRRAWRGLFWCLGGTAVGILVNPYFPRNIASYAFNLYRSFSGLESAMSSATEWYPPPAWQVVTLAPGAALGLLIAGVAGRWCRPRVESIALLALALLTLLMTARAQRYMEYYPPAAVLAAAFTVRDFCAGSVEAGSGDRRRGLALALALLMAATPALALPRVPLGIREAQDFRTFKGAAEWLDQHSRPGDLVFNLEYDDFPQLFFYNTRNHYVVGLDPVYLCKYDPNLFALWQQVSGLSPERPADLYEALKNRFRARFVVMENARTPHFQTLVTIDEFTHRTEGVGRRILSRYADEFVTVFEVM